MRIISENGNRVDSSESAWLEEARRLIEDDQADAEGWFIAGLLVSMDRRSTYDDLLACLKRPVIRRMAGEALHQRTGRPRHGDEVVVSARNWKRYLKTRKGVESSEL